MFTSFAISREKAGLLVIDVQDKLFPHLERRSEVLSTIQMVIKGFQILGLPIVVSEQYPEGLGQTMAFLRDCFEPNFTVHSKTAFSCLQDPNLKEQILGMAVTQWIVTGVEAHVCVLQTVRDLLMADKQVVVLNDAITSRSLYDYSTAIAEMRDFGARISSTETVLFELMGDSKCSEFKDISLLVK